jgi:hypothetical protein
MMRIDSFIHRSSLSEVISRWMVDTPAPGDVMRLKTIVNLNWYIARLWVDFVACDILEAFHGIPPIRYQAGTKGQLKDFAVTHPPYTTARIEEMRLRYNQFPEDFYRDAPIDGMIYAARIGGDEQLIGSSRIKLFRRIAEKGSRRIIDFMLNHIRASADILAEGRARSLGISKAQLITSPERMAEEFSQAESRILKGIKNGTFKPQSLELEIPDVAGVKTIIEPRDYRRFRNLLAVTPGLTIAEEEHHSGNYNAINLKVAYVLPKERILAEPPNEAYLRLLSYRGFNAADVGRQYREFVESGEDEVRFEMIVAGFQEFLESEIGRSMHEERIQAQRAREDYNGHLATNIRYLMNFILSLCLSPWNEDLQEIPIKLWVKYMPDSIDRVMRRLYIPDTVRDIALCQ